MCISCDRYRPKQFTPLHFQLYIGIVYHFDTVNHLDMVETGHMRVHQPPCSQDCEKAGRGLGTRLSSMDGWA